MARLIDADALQDLEEMEYIYFSSPASVPFYQANAVWDVIENAPTIEAEPVKHGRWNAHDSAGISIAGFMVCSFCDVMIPTADNNRYCLPRLYYCPKCGSKMDLEDNA